MSVQYTGGVQYNGGCSVHRGDIMSTVVDVMSTLGGVQYTGGYHDKCGGRSLRKHLNLYGNPGVLNMSQCTHDIPHTHHGIPQCTHGIPQCTEHPHCTHDIPQCTEHPLMYSMIPPVY